MKKTFIIIGTILLLSACGNEKEEIATDPIADINPDVYANFQSVDIQIENNLAIVTGEVKASDDEFYYQVEQGDQLVKEEEKVTVDGEWGDFELKLDITEEMKKAEEIVIVKMYTKGEGDQIVNPNYIPLDLEE